MEKAIRSFDFDWIPSHTHTTPHALRKFPRFLSEMAFAQKLAGAGARVRRGEPNAAAAWPKKKKKS